MRFSFQTSLNRLRGAKLVDPEVAQAEQLFQAPPFTPAVADAVRPIATQFPIRADEESRLLIQSSANGMCEREYEALAPLFSKLPKPQRVLEVGPGIGRSVVYFQKKSVWGDDAEVHLYDANGTTTKYKGKHFARPPQWPDVSSFCGNLAVLQHFLEYNQITNSRIFDAAELPLGRLPGPYDLIYGFFSIGFHWSVEFYLDELEGLLEASGVLVCTLGKLFKPFPRLKDFSVRIVACREIKKHAAPLRLLALSKGALPEVGLSLAEAYPRSRW